MYWQSYIHMAPSLIPIQSLRLKRQCTYIFSKTLFATMQSAVVSGMCDTEPIFIQLERNPEVLTHWNLDRPAGI